MLYQANLMCMHAGNEQCASLPVLMGCLIAFLFHIALHLIKQSMMSKACSFQLVLQCSKSMHSLGKVNQ